MIANENHRILAGGARIEVLILTAVLLVSCSASWIDGRPSDAKLRYGIKYLISEFEKRHPQMVSWKDSVVRIQLAKPLPKGRATEAGWTIEWRGSTSQELSRVVVPWSLLGPRPNHYENDSTNYTGGTPAPKDVTAQIRSSKETVDPWFAAIVNVRLSKTDPNWAVFTAVPYLPVTDIATGWAQDQNGHWKVLDFGTAQIGCGVTPLPVLQEFSFSCPPS